MRLKAPVTHPQQIMLPKKKRMSLGKLFYLLVLLIMAVAAVRWGVRYLGFIQAPGLIEGKKIVLEASVSAKIDKMTLQVGDMVNKGDELIFLDAQGLIGRIKQQESEVGALRAACDNEQRSLPILLEEKNSQVSLKQSTIKQNQQRLMGETRQLQLRLTQLNNNLANQNRQLSEGRRLLKINAITHTKLQVIEIKTQALKNEISRTNLRLQTSRQELIQIQNTLDIIKADKSSLPEQIKGKSILPVLRAKLMAASQRLELLQAQLKERIISAPFSGVVTQVFKQADEVVMTGEAIAEIVDPESLWVKVYFDPKYQAQLAEGDRVQLEFDNQLKSEGIIQKFYPATTPLPPQFQKVYEPHKRALIAEVQPVDKKEWPLTIGMGVKVRKKKW